MPRAPKLCSNRTCRASALPGYGQCATHKPAPFEGAKQRWLAGRPTDWDKRRKIIIKFYQGRCATCGRPANEVDHIEPVADGGSWELDNLVLLCAACHKKKTQEHSAARRRR